ncbi:hypothetical protein SAMN04488078_1011101 [Antarctobacter heliothermus]|uniref:Uncharacterized protein n=1 Tax=Antarctobacter heliothermus TaxID=74033 RepID=A0A239DS50_9RHOB|nr:hypothetical protein SAMN04488078_1011101 [Antarctobacter heliothermus]
MRTLFCSHLNGVLVELSSSRSNSGSGTRQPTADHVPASSGEKYPGGELPKGQEGAAPPAHRQGGPTRNPLLGVPA